MKVYFLSEYFEPDGCGGTPTMLPTLARELKRRYDDLDIEVITSRNVYRGTGLPLLAYESWEGIRIHRLSTPRSNRATIAARLVSGGLFTMAALKTLTRMPAPDLLLIGTNPPAAPMAAQALARLRSVPYLYLIHDLYPDVAVALQVLSPNGTLAKIGHTLQRSWLLGATGVVVIGRCMQEYLAEQYGLPPERATVIPNWADMQAIMPLPKRTEFRTRHKLDGFIVLYAGNFGMHQKFDTILDAAKVLQGLHPQITFVFVGDGAKRKHIARRVEEERLTNTRLFPLVPCEELPDLLASADVSLVTLEPGMEGIGVPSKLYNILASGRPVIALVAERSEVTWVIREAQCGIRIDHSDVRQLVATLVDMVNSPERLARMGRNARAVLEERYSLDAATRAFYELFREVAGQPEELVWHT